MALKSMKVDSIPCGVLSHAHFSILDCLCIALHENLSIRRFNDIEKSMAILRLTGCVPEEDILRSYMPMLGLPSHRDTLRLFMRLEFELDEETKLRLAKGKLTLGTIKGLLDMEPEIRRLVTQGIIDLNLNINQQRYFIEYLNDVALTRNAEIPEIMKDLNLDKPPEPNRPQRAHSVLKSLRAMRYPRLAQAERVFQRKIASLSLPKDVKIAASAYFEDSNYRLEILFKTGRDLKTKIDDLSENTGLEDLGDPWETGDDGTLAHH